MSDTKMEGREPVALEDAWLVWSYRRGAWWGPNRCGYTSLSGAGVYTEAEAKQIADDANRHGGKKEEEARPLAPYLRDAQPGSVLAALTALTPAGAP